MGEKTHFVIAEEEDWADEFNYPLVSVGKTEDLEAIKKDFEASSIGQFEMAFGTNEEFLFSRSEVRNILDKAKLVKAETLVLLAGLGFAGMGLDFIATLSQILKEEE